MALQVWRPIRAEFRRILLTIAGIPSVHYEMMSFTPTVGDAWLREAIEKGPSVTRTLGLEGMTEERAIYLLDLYWPANGVKADGEDLADKIRLTFWHGRQINGAGPDWIKGRVLTSEVRRVIPGDTWIVFPIRISFFIRRPTAQGYPGYAA